MEEPMDKLTEERMQVLKMIQDGKITAEEGARLLSALKASTTRSGAGQVAGSDMPGSAGKWFRVRVTDLRTGRRKAVVNIPLGLVDVGLKLGARFGTSNIDMNEIVSAVKSGAVGKIADVEDDDEQEKVEIYID
jgi:hypothetical protein